MLNDQLSIKEANSKSEIISFINKPIYIIYSDVVNGSLLDKRKDMSDVIGWRKKVFSEQLEKLLILSNTEVKPIKTVGDALFLTLGSEIDIHKLLSQVYLAYSSLHKEGYSIRVAINLVDETDYIYGKEIADEIRTKEYFLHDYEYFLEALSGDVFGNEINKTARFLSVLNGNGGIIVSGKIAHKLKLESNDYSPLDTISIKTEGLEYGNLILTNPTPLFFLKNVYSHKDEYNNEIQKYLDENNKVPIIWELVLKEEKYNGTEITRSNILKEIKKSICFRFIITQINEDSINEDRFLKYVNAFDSEFVPSFDEDWKQLLRYRHIDCLFKVNHYFQLKDLEFIREAKRPGSPKEICELILPAGVDGSFHSKLDIIFDENDHKVKCKIQNVSKRTYSLIPYVAVTSANSIDYNSYLKEYLINRQYFKRKEIGKGEECIFIESSDAQTLDIYKKIHFSEEVLANIKKNEIDITWHNGKFILVYFSFFYNKLDRATDMDFFKSIYNERFKTISIYSYGHIRGLLDGFLLFKIKSPLEIEKAINELLNLYCNEREVSILQYTYPISLFILESSDLHNPINTNLYHLSDFNE